MWGTYIRTVYSLYTTHCVIINGHLLRWSFTYHFESINLGAINWLWNGQRTFQVIMEWLSFVGGNEVHQHHGKAFCLSDICPYCLETRWQAAPSRRYGMRRNVAQGLVHSRWRDRSSGFGPQLCNISNIPHPPTRWHRCLMLRLLNERCSYFFPQFFEMVRSLDGRGKT